MSRRWYLAIAALAALLALIFSLGAACPTSLEDLDEGSSEADDDEDRADDDADLSDNGNGTLIDLDNSLMWQEQPTALDQNWVDANRACKTLNSVGFAGFRDWRLPKIDELRLLVSGCAATATGGACGVTAQCLEAEACYDDACYGCTAGEGAAAANGCYWSPLLTGACGAYWSASFDPATQHPWVLSFDAAMLLSDDPGYAADARCVRPLYAPLEDGGDYAAYDPLTHLTWQNAPSKFGYSYDDAWGYCEQLVLGDREDWRLPTIDELRSLVRGCPETERNGKCGVTAECNLNACYSDACKGCDADGLHYDPLLTFRAAAHDKNYISATFHHSEGRAGDECAWYVDFERGRVACLHNDAAAEVRCVSGGE